MVVFRYQHWSIGGVIWGVVLLLSLPSIVEVVVVVDAYKHNYFTKHDDRTLIGPLGYPFGFLATGHYNLTVFDFQLSIGVHDDNDNYIHGGGGGGGGNNGHHHHPSSIRNLRSHEEPLSEEELDELVNGVGFLLKKFDDEAEFNHYMAWLEANATRCAFQPYLNVDGDDDDAAYDDDVLTKDDDEYSDHDGGVGEMLDPTKEGIFLNMKPKSRWGPSNTPIVSYDFEKGQQGYYFLIYQICVSDTWTNIPHIHSKFELDFHSSNLDMFGNESYLSAGEMILPHMFFYFSLLYMICCYLWISNICIIKKGGVGHFEDDSSSDTSTPGRGRRRGYNSNKPIVYPIHYLMAALLVLKTAAIFFESIRYHYLRVSGQTHFWSAVYYTFAFMKATMLFTVILLIGSGWSFVKPFLTDREKHMACAILGLQTINNLAIVVLTQRAEGEKSFDRWTAILHMVDILCCCAVLIPIVWQVNALEKNIEQSNGDHNDTDDDVQSNENDDHDDAILREEELDNGDDNDESKNDRRENGRLAAKLKLFRSFYLLVVCYIYVTRIVVYLFASMLDYRHEWLQNFVIELVTLSFYCIVGMQFRPMSENPYLTVSTNKVSEDGTDEEQIELTAQSNGVF